MFAIFFDPDSRTFAQQEWEFTKDFVEVNAAAYGREYGLEYLFCQEGPLTDVQWEELYDSLSD